MAQKTHYKKLRNPKYMGSYELMTGGEPVQLVVEITKVTKEMVHNGSKEEEQMVLHLKNQKPMICNATNAKAITKAHGTPYVEDWVGKSITLFVQRVRSNGAFEDRLRVREEAPKEPTKEDLNPLHEKWNGAITALQQGKTSIQAIQTKYNVNDENLKLLQDATVQMQSE